MSTEKMRRLAAGYREGTKSFMESCKAGAAATPLCGEIAFCPYCGARSIDAGSQRTYCTTCGEDVVTPGQVEDLENQLAQEKDDYADLEKNLEEAEAEVKDLTRRIESQLEDLEKQDLLLAECKAVLEAIIAEDGLLSAQSIEKVIAIHRRLP